jgi:hypothetical protein
MVALERRTQAEEARFFRAEDELALRRRMEKFVGTRQLTTTQPGASSASLNEFQRECLAASKRSLAKKENVLSVNRLNPLKVDIDVEGYAKRGKLAHNTFMDYLKVPQVSMGRAKWEIHEDASVFSIADGKRLALSGIGEEDAASEMPLRNPRSVKVEVARQTRIESSQVVQDTYKGYRMYPKLNPGRAFVWGSVLALWGSCFLVVCGSKLFRINSVEDLDTFVNRSMEKPVQNIKTSLTQKLKPAEAGEYQKFQNNKFFDNLKTKWN